jgi:heme-degrading monooxygenase HmoA
LEYVIYQTHRGSFQRGKERRSSKKVVDFYDGLAGKVKGFKGFIMTGSLDDPQKAVNVSLWESREDMDNYYANDKEYASFLESLKPLIEQEIEKSDYMVFKRNLGM